LHQHLVATKTVEVLRKQVEEALRESEERYRVLVETAPDVVYIISDDGTLASLNPAFETITGWSRAEWLGKPFVPLVHPEDAPLAVTMFQTVLRGARPSPYQLRIRSKSGKYLVGEFTSTPYIKDGKVAGKLGIVRDITERKQVEEALRESSSQMQLAIEAAKMGIWRADLTTQTVISSKTSGPVSGLPSGEAPTSQEEFLRLIHPEDRPRVAQHLSEAIEKTGKYQVEFRIVRRDGTIQWVYARGQVFHDANGQPTFMTGVDVDITERKQAEEALGKSEQKYRELVQNANSVILRWNCHGEIVFMNEFGQAFFGYTEKEIIGKNVVGTIVPESESAGRDLRPLMQQICANPSAFEHNVNENMRRDGSRVWLAWTNKAVLDDRGQVVEVFSVGSDITAQRQVEERIAKLSSLKQRLLGTDSINEKLKLITDGVVGIFGADFARIWLTKEADLCQKGCRHARMVEGPNVCRDRTHCLHLIASSGRYTQIDGSHRRVPLGCYKIGRVASGEDAKFVTNDVTIDPRVHDHEWARSLGLVSFAGYRLLSPDGKPIGVLALFSQHAILPEVAHLLEDLANTASQVIIAGMAEEGRRKLEAQMQQAQKLESLGILAGGIAHDFNNLLTATLGHADLALANLPPESPIRENLKEIDDASRRAAELCRQMLAYSGRGKFVVELINLSRLAQELTHLLQVSVSKKTALRRHFAADLPAIEADPAQVRQVVMNLVINASEAIGDNEGVIAISTGAMHCDEVYLRGSYLAESVSPGTYVYFEVTDTGCGMDAETRSKMFDPFFTTKFAGRGLGLAAVLGIVRSHKGAIKMNSEPGKGTTFRVLFPASTKTAKRPEPDVASGLWRGSGTILVVDDEEPVRVVAKKMMERWGFHVLTAADGNEAIKLFQENPGRIACVLLDLTMPRKDGVETYRELRRARNDVRVILTSGYTEQEISRRFAGQDIAGFIEKPFEMTTLNAKLREVLTRERASTGK
jgi:PAS domain S-box-containing protein